MAVGGAWKCAGVRCVWQAGIREMHRFFAEHTSAAHGDTRKRAATQQHAARAWRDRGSLCARRLRRVHKQDHTVAALPRRC